MASSVRGMEWIPCLGASSPIANPEPGAAASSSNQAIAAPVVRLSRRQVPPPSTGEPAGCDAACLHLGTVQVALSWFSRPRASQISSLTRCYVVEQGHKLLPLCRSVARSLTSYNSQPGDSHRSIDPSIHHPSGRPPLIIPLILRASLICPRRIHCIHRKHHLSPPISSSHPSLSSPSPIQGTARWLSAPSPASSFRHQSRFTRVVHHSRHPPRPG